MSKLSSAITGIRPTNASEKNENENNVSRMCEISGSRRGDADAREQPGEPALGDPGVACRGYFAHSSPITANT